MPETANNLVTKLTTSLRRSSDVTSTADDQQQTQTEAEARNKDDTYHFRRKRQAQDIPTNAATQSNYAPDSNEAADDVTRDPRSGVWDLYHMEEEEDDEDADSDFPPSTKPKPSRIKFKAYSNTATSLRGTKRRREISNEMTLKRMLMRDYDLTSRPVINDSTTVTVSVGMSLFHILDTVSLSLCVEYITNNSEL